MSRALALVDSPDESRQHASAPLSRALLETKLYVPRSRSSLVARPRLITTLGEGATHKLTLVIAPAGFGKTTLLAHWLGNSKTAGWVSLDPGDNDPATFWAYVMRAIQKSNPDVGAAALAALPSSPIESVLTTLINEVAAVDDDFVIVLDDYHVIDAAPIQDGLAFLLDHLPPRMHVVIATRAEPTLPLPRFRARGELTELRVADLRFTRDEASAFFSQSMSLDLSPGDAATLERRTEGWIAGLKLAALSLKGRDDVRAFVDGFSGDNRYVADYLVAEVLQSESEHVRRFLLGTSILDRLNGPLCDAVIGGRDSAALLDSLDRRNLFIVALDDRREWYRYHHLFADVLQDRLVATDPEGARTFHRRASAWYEENGSNGRAIHHALGAADYGRAAALLERSWPEKDRSYKSRKWLGWVKLLPAEIIRVRPVLGMGYAWSLLNSGELEAAEPRLRDVEDWLQRGGGANPSGEMVVNDNARFGTLPSELAAARVYLAQSLGDVPGTLEHAKRALDLTPKDDHASHASAIALVALALWGRGDLEAAHTTFADALATMHEGGHILSEIRGRFVLGDIRVAQGRLRAAATIYEKGIEFARVESPAAAVETDELHLGLSELHREWNDLAAAHSHLEAITQSTASRAHAGNRLRWCAAMARVHEARGDLTAALILLDEADTHERRDPLPRTRPIAAMRARIWVAQDRLDDAMDWVTSAKLSARDDLSYLREFEHITLARVLIARSANDANDAITFLDRLLAEAQAGGRAGSVIEILMLQSLAQQAAGNTRGALEPLLQSLALAEPEGYLRIYLDEGDRVRDLLRHATIRGMSNAYTPRVLATFDATQSLPAVSLGDEGLPLQALTTREQEILRLIGAGMRNQQIAEHLSISTATVKRHIANAYSKLGATHRVEALARANELKLL